tara:strand:- start:19792 stop:23154 length:3363 start_codon:yes stop_codon:yes gene_type:complete
MSLYKDRLMVDHSWASNPLEEMQKRFVMERASESPLKGWWGVPFQVHQTLPRMAVTFANSVENVFEEDTVEVIGVPDEVATTGVIGVTGPIGFIGPIGDTGPNSGSGSTGLIGPTGPDGDAGEDGNPGNQGKIGERGDTGPTSLITGPTYTDSGPVGVRGDTGDTGIMPTGDVGPGGPVGDTGPTGSGAGEDCGCCIGTDEVWIAFPEPNYPTSALGDPNGEGSIQAIEDSVIVGESHSFVLYFTHPTTGAKIIFWPGPGSYDGGSTWTYYNDFKDKTATITVSQPVETLSEWGNSNDFLIADVATELTRAECEELGAYRRGIGDWDPIIGNVIDGYGVCGCSEVTIPALGKTAKQVHIDTNAAINEAYRDNEYCTGSMWNICGWDTQGCHANQFTTNSKGRFIVGSSIKADGEPAAWHGWTELGDEATTNTRSCINCEGCEWIGEHYLGDWDPNDPVGEGCFSLDAKCCDQRTDSDCCSYEGYHFWGGNIMEGDPESINYCFTINPSDSNTQMYYANPSSWGVSPGHPVWHSGLWACNSNEDWGVYHDDSHGNPAVQDAGPTPMHGIEYGQDQYGNWTNCLWYQCCRDNWGDADCDAEDECHWVWDRGVTGAGKAWQGKIMLRSVGIVHGHDDDCDVSYAGSSIGHTRGLAEQDGYYAGDLIYRPGHSHMNGLVRHYTLQSGYPLLEQHVRYAIPGIGGDTAIGSAGDPEICIAPEGTVGTESYDGEYTKDDYLPTKYKATLTIDPKKPFPSLVMNGVTIGNKLRAWHAANPGTLNDLTSIDVGVMVITYWQVESTISTWNTLSLPSDEAERNEPWPFYDPWPDQGPTRDYEDYFQSVFGCFPGTSDKTNAHSDYRPRADWHCKVGGYVTPRTQKSIQGDGSYGDCTLMGTDHQRYDVYRQGYDWNWTECDFCIGGRFNNFEEGVNDPDYYRTHHGYRQNIGSPAIGFHGYGVRSSLNTGVPVGSIWDSLDNGVNCFQFYHWIDGVMHGITHDMPNWLHSVGDGEGDPHGNTSSSDGDNYWWYYARYSAGPWKYKVTGISGQEQAYTSLDKGTDGTGMTVIMRMEEYLNDFFGLPAWTFNIDMDWQYTPNTSNPVSSANAPCYATLTDYTIESVCVTVT